MTLRFVVFVSFILAGPGCFLFSPKPVLDEPARIDWRSWGKEVFEEAKSEGKLVLLDLGAVWCHWCHVMEETTYRDEEVVRIVTEGYIPVTVDQAKRPDLAQRYQEYGWPATILFDANGVELMKFRGYIPPLRARQLFLAFRDDPTPGPSIVAQDAISYAQAPTVSPRLKEALFAINSDHYDPIHGGWGTIHKYLHAPSVDFCLSQDDPQFRAMARKTLDGQLSLIDPEFGGVYQYSHGGVWENPHFEKIMSMQADNLRVYSQAYLVFGEPKYLAAASSIFGYLERFLHSPAGGYYASQDADLVAGEHAEDYFALPDMRRLDIGIPTIDTHIYSRENGWAIRGMARYFAASGDEASLLAAREAADWIRIHRSVPGGGFCHESREDERRYLGDSLAMGQAFLELYAVTAERDWLRRALATGHYILETFSRPGELPGVVTAIAPDFPGSAVPGPDRDENVEVARFANLLFRYTGQEKMKELSLLAMTFLATPEIARRRPVGGVLLAAHELEREPLEVMILGSRESSIARELFTAALALGVEYKRVEWWDPKTEDPPDLKAPYPDLGEPSAFVCVAGTCSSPLTNSLDLVTTVQRMTQHP